MTDSKSQTPDADAKEQAKRDAELVRKIEESIESGKPVDAHLDTDQRVLARVTDGIYRQPASALRELIANAYDADSTCVSITTDAPRFGAFKVADDGNGMGPDALANLVLHIGGSAKRTQRGAILKVTGTDPNRSPGGRRLIGKIGIGLFSIAQLTRQFVITTKRQNDLFKLFAHVTLNRFDESELSQVRRDGQHVFRAGEVRIWSEKTSDKKGQGTTIHLMNLLPRVVHILQSRDVWNAIDDAKTTGEKERVPPLFHVGRINPDVPDQLLLPPEVPWDDRASSSRRFEKLVEKMSAAWLKSPHYARLEHACDSYFQAIWSLGLSLPLPYVEKHPFELRADEVPHLYRLPSKLSKKPLERVTLEGKKTIATTMDLDKSADSAKEFLVDIDGVELRRPVRYHGYPKTKQALQGPIMFVGSAKPDMTKIPETQRGGPLSFSAYLFWTPQVVPHEHRGLLIRINGASGTLFDPTFLRYQVGERRLNQLTGEVFVHEGLDGALNIDRESFNTAHPHYQILASWVHNNLRLVRNTIKSLQADSLKARKKRDSTSAEKAVVSAANKVIEAHTDYDPDDIPELIIANNDDELEAALDAGNLALPRKALEKALAGVEWTEPQLAAVSRLLYAFDVLEGLEHDQQVALVSGLIKVMKT